MINFRSSCATLYITSIYNYFCFLLCFSFLTTCLTRFLTFQIVQALSKAAHLGKISSIPAPNDSYEEPATPKKHKKNSVSSKLKDKPIHFPKTDDELKQVEQEEDTLFSFESSEHDCSLKNLGESKNSKSNDPSMNSHDAEKTTNTIDRSAWRRRSFEKLAKFRRTAETELNAAKCREREVNENAGLVKDGQHTLASPKHKDEEKGGAWINQEVHYSDTSDLFSFRETAQKVALQFIDCTQIDASEAEKPKHDTDASDNDEEIFNSVETPIQYKKHRKSSAQMIQANDSQRKLCKASSAFKECQLNGFETSTESTEWDEIASQPKEFRSNPGPSEEDEYELFNFMQTPSKTEIPTVLSESSRDTLKMAAVACPLETVIDDDDDIFNAVTTPENKSGPKNSPVFRMSSERTLKSNTSEGRLDSSSARNKESPSYIFKNTSTCSSVNQTWRRRSFAKLLRFKYEADGESDKVETEKMTCEYDSLCRPSENLAVLRKDQSPRSVGDNLASVTGMKQEESNAVQVEATRSSPAVVSREKILKTLERFKVTPSPKRRKVLS